MQDFAQSASGRETITVEALSRMSRGELEELYGEASVPSSLEALDGEPRGTLLAVTGLDREPLAGLRRRLGTSALLPWEGKNFRSQTAERGEGGNRIRFVGELAPFSTSIQPSGVDGAPCIELDYDRPDNPAPIRRIRDELRQVAPGLFFGPASVDVGGRRIVFLYFAVDFAGA